MAKKKAEPILSPLVTRGFELRLKIAGLLIELKALEKQLVEQGAGPYADEAGNECTVVGATLGSAGTDKYALAGTEEAELKARELAGDDDNFKKLFDRHVSYTPCDGFHLVVPKLLTPAKARDLVALCLVPGKGSAPKDGYVKWKDA